MKPQTIALCVVTFIGGMIVYYFVSKQYPQQQLDKLVTQQVSLMPVENILTDIKDEISSEKPVGQVFNRSYDVTEQITMIDQQREHAFPITSCDLTNVGPNPIYFSVNEWDWPEAPLPVNQSINLDLKRQGAIAKIYLKCDPGETSTAYMYIIR